MNYLLENYSSATGSTGGSGGRGGGGHGGGGHGGGGYGRHGGGGRDWGRGPGGYYYNYPYGYPYYPYGYPSYYPYNNIYVKNCSSGYHYDPENPNSDIYGCVKDVEIIKEKIFYPTKLNDENPSKNPHHHRFNKLLIIILSIFINFI